jgi:hypothetical protein
LENKLGTSFDAPACLKLQDATLATTKLSKIVSSGPSIWDDTRQPGDQGPKALRMIAVHWASDHSFLRSAQVKGQTMNLTDYRYSVKRGNRAELQWQREPMFGRVWIRTCDERQSSARRTERGHREVKCLLRTGALTMTRGRTATPFDICDYIALASASKK